MSISLPHLCADHGFRVSKIFCHHSMAGSGSRRPQPLSVDHVACVLHSTCNLRRVSKVEAHEVQVHTAEVPTAEVHTVEAHKAEVHTAEGHRAEVHKTKGHKVAQYSKLQHVKIQQSESPTSTTVQGSEVLCQVMRLPGDSNPLSNAEQPPLERIRRPS